MVRASAVPARRLPSRFLSWHFRKAQTASSFFPNLEVPSTRSPSFFTLNGRAWRRRTLGPPAGSNFRRLWNSCGNQGS
jgi:hypothetical protein